MFSITFQQAESFQKYILLPIEVNFPDDNTTGGDKMLTGSSTWTESVVLRDISDATTLFRLLDI
jgi:hypothetical protein